MRDCERCFTCREVEDGDNYSVGSTFFLHSNETPRCAMEALALQIFNLHSKGKKFDPLSSGAEWWTQYIDHRDDIGFHWDRDYGLEEDEELHVHPHLGTVTYLSSIRGAPTVIFGKKGTFEFGSDASGPLSECVLSYPIFGKHICFNGELLHGAPSDLVYPSVDKSNEGVRVTFLVNIWLDHVPIQSQRLDESISKSLETSCATVTRKPLRFEDRQMICKSSAPSTRDVAYKWEIGGSEYIIDIFLPDLNSLRGVRDKTVVDFIRLSRGSMYPGELTSESSDDDSEESSSISSAVEDPSTNKRTKDPERKDDVKKRRVE